MGGAVVWGSMYDSRSMGGGVVWGSMYDSRSMGGAVVWGTSRVVNKGVCEEL